MQKLIFNLIAKFNGNLNLFTIPRFLVEVFKSHHMALFMSQLMYWIDKTGREWIYKTDKEWSEELLLSERTIREIRTKLKNMCLIETKAKKVNGIKVMHYKINKEKFIELLLEVAKSSDRSGKFCQTKVANSATPLYTDITTEITNNLYNIAEPACVLEEEKNKKEKNTHSKSQTENLPCENIAGKKRQKSLKTENNFIDVDQSKKKTKNEEDIALKELKKLIAKIYAIKYQETTGLKYPSSDYGKLMKLAEKVAKYLLKQYQEGVIKTPENIIYRVLVLINFAFIRKKTDPAYIFGKIAESYAELKTYSQDERPFYKKQVEQALEQANQMEEDIFQISQDFLKLFKEE